MVARQRLFPPHYRPLVWSIFRGPKNLEVGRNRFRERNWFRGLLEDINFSHKTSVVRKSVKKNKQAAMYCILSSPLIATWKHCRHYKCWRQSRKKQALRLFGRHLPLLSRTRSPVSFSFWASFDGWCYESIDSCYGRENDDDFLSCKIKYIRLLLITDWCAFLLMLHFATSILDATSAS